jgi:hypothetical protein
MYTFGGEEKTNLYFLLLLLRTTVHINVVDEPASTLRYVCSSYYKRRETGGPS